MSLTGKDEALFMSIYFLLLILVVLAFFCGTVGDSKFIGLSPNRFTQTCNHLYRKSHKYDPQLTIIYFSWKVAVVIGNGTDIHA